MKTWQRMLMEHPAWGWTIIILLLLVMIPGASRLKVDNELESWFLQDDPAFLAYESFKETFGNDEVVLLLLEDQRFTDDDQSFELEILQDLNALPHLQANISSLAALDPDLAALYQELPIDHLVAHPRTDQHIAWLILGMLPEPSQDRSDLLKQIDELESARTGLTIYKAGYGVIYDEINRISIEESTLFIVLSYIIILIVSFLFMGRIRAVAIGGLGVILTLIVTLGVMGYAGWDINMVSLALPSLVFAVSIADVLHVFRVLQFNRVGAESLDDESQLTILYEATKPCFYTSITTFFGFLSLTIAKIQIIREFGMSAALAVMIAYVLILLVVLPTFLRFMQPGLVKSSPSPGWGRLFHFIKKRRGLIIATTGFIFVFSILGLLRLEVDTYSIGFLLPENDIRQDSDQIEADFGNYLPLDFLYKTTPQQTKDSLWRQELSDFEAAVIRTTDLERGLSLNDLLGLDSPSGAILQSNIPVVADSGRLGRTMFRAPMLSAQELSSIQDEVMTLANEHLSLFSDYRFAGYMPLYAVMMDYILEGQLESFGLAFLVISLLLLILFRSFKRLLLSLIPNLLPVLGTLGLMGWLNIPLDIATVTIAAIAIGIVVDDTVHFLHHYFHFKDGAMDSGNAILKTLEMTGGAIMATSILLIAGLSVLLFTTIYSVIYFGLLLIICIVLALLCDFLLLPALLIEKEQI